MYDFVFLGVSCLSKTNLVSAESWCLERFAKSLTRLIPPEALLLELGVHSHSGETIHEHHEQ